MSHWPQQLEIIYPDGRIEYPMLKATGITKIGRHPSNDIVVDSPGVATFHLVLDHRQTPYRLLALTQQGGTFLDGQVLPANVSTLFYSWKTLQFAGCSLVLLDEADLLFPGPPPGAALPQHRMLTTTAGGQVGTMPRDNRSDDIILADVQILEQTIDAGQTATYSVVVQNGGNFVADFVVSMIRVDPKWVEMSAEPLPIIAGRGIQLSERDETTVTITVTPPREPSSLAGRFTLAIEVFSPTREYAGRLSRTNVILTINPFYQFNLLPIRPKRKTINWFYKVKDADGERIRGLEVQVPVRNRGNSKTRFRVEGISDDQGTAIEFNLPAAEGQQTEGEVSQQQKKHFLSNRVEFTLPPDQKKNELLLAHVLPHRSRLIAFKPSTYAYTVNVIALEGEQTQQSVQGQLTTKPLIGKWTLLLIVFFMAILLVYIYLPNISTFESDRSVVQSGQTVTLSWTSTLPPFSLVGYRLDGSEVQGTETTITPQSSKSYTLQATTWVSRLFPSFIEPAKSELTVNVQGITPNILLFEAQPTGRQSVILSWLVVEADEVSLINQTDDQLAPVVLDQPVGSMEVKPEIDTLYALRAVNHNQEKNPVSRPLLVTMTPVPPPLAPLSTPEPSRPIIEEFIIEPRVISSGQTINLTWKVSGQGLEQVTIDPLGDLPISGAVQLTPKETTLYKLTAVITGQQVITFQEVLVDEVSAEEEGEAPPIYEVINVETENDCRVVRVKGHVFDEKNVPLAGVILEVGELDVPGSRFQVITDENGRYIFDFGSPNKDPHTWFVVPLLADKTPAISPPHTFKTDPEEFCRNFDGVHITTIDWQRTQAAN